MKELNKYSIDDNSNTPKYEQVRQILLKYIENTPDNQEFLPYEHDIIEALGVGRITVRRALLELRNEGIIETARNRGSRILKKNVLKQEEENQQRKNLFVGVTMAAFVYDRKPQSSNSFNLNWQILDYFEKIIQQSGASLLVYNLNNKQWQDNKQLAADLQKHNVKWAISFMEKDHYHIDSMQYLQNNNVKIVKVGIYNCSTIPLMTSILPGMDWVTINIQSTLYSSLLQLKDSFKSAAFITRLTDMFWAEERFAVLEKVCRDCNYPLEIVKVDEVNEKAGFEGAQQLIPFLTSHESPLIVAANDFVACGAMKALTKQNLSIPDDVQVLAFDNYSGFREENMSTFSHNEEAYAKALFDLASCHFLSESDLPQGRIVYPVFLPRSTTKPVAYQN